jgi:hypothetical protein
VLACLKNLYLLRTLILPRALIMRASIDEDL